MALRKITFSWHLNTLPRKTLTMHTLKLASFLFTLIFTVGLNTVFWRSLEARADEPSAVVLMYHRFGEEQFPSTNITIKQFESHLNELKSNSYNVIGLPEIISSLKNNKKLPDRTIGISIDDAYLSIFTKAWPRLKALGFPFTVFVATKPIDQKNKNYMSWEQLKEISEAGVTIGSQTANHPHLTYLDDSNVERELSLSNARFLEKLGSLPQLFAYPYGEASLKTEKIVKTFGFSAAFGQHSGVISFAENIFYLPRFTMNEKYGSLSRLKLVANALPLPVTDITPKDHVIGDYNPPLMGFTVTGKELVYLKHLNCFASHEGQTKVEQIGKRRFEIRVKTPFPKGRTRLNCTLFGPENRWHWLGRQFFVP